MSIHVFTAEELLQALKSDPTKVLTIENKREEKTYTMGSSFKNARFTIGNLTRKDGWFAVRDVKLRGMADPTDKNDPRNQTEGMRMQLETTAGTSGAWGESIKILNPIFVQSVTPLATGQKAVAGLMQTHISAENKKAELRGQAIEDPPIRYKVDFSNYKEGYPLKSLVGTPVTIFHDYTKPYQDDKGKTQYELATVLDENEKPIPVTSENVHRFVTKGSILRYGRVHMPSVAISKVSVSMPAYMTKAIIEPGLPEGFSDDDLCNIADLKLAIGNKLGEKEGVQEGVLENKEGVLENKEGVSENKEGVQEGVQEEKTLENVADEPVSDGVQDFMDAL